MPIPILIRQPKQPKMKLSKKAQMKMVESIFVLFIFTIIIAFVLVFYFVFQKGEVQRLQHDMDEQKAVETGLMLSGLPELQCSSSAISEGACIDRFKLEALASEVSSGNRELELHYYDLLGFGNISIVQIYPTEKSWQLYYNPPREGKYSRRAIHFPIVIKDVSTNPDINGFGIMTVFTHIPKK